MSRFGALYHLDGTPKDRTTQTTHGALIWKRSVRCDANTWQYWTVKPSAAPALSSRRARKDQPRRGITTKRSLLPPQRWQPAHGMRNAPPCSFWLQDAC
eukprot:7335025-Pyramimonas_sp.AAC.1